MISGTGNPVTWQRSSLQKTIIFVVIFAQKWGLFSELLFLQHCWWRLENLILLLLGEHLFYIAKLSIRYTVFMNLCESYICNFTLYYKFLYPLLIFVMFWSMCVFSFCRLVVWCPLLIQSWVLCVGRHNCSKWCYAVLHPNITEICDAAKDQQVKPEVSSSSEWKFCAFISMTVQQEPNCVWFLVHWRYGNVLGCKKKCVVKW